MKTFWNRLLCLLLGHKWKNCLTVDSYPIDRRWEPAQYCKRCWKTR